MSDERVDEEQTRAIPVLLLSSSAKLYVSSDGVWRQRVPSTRTTRTTRFLFLWLVPQASAPHPGWLPESHAWRLPLLASLLAVHSPGSVCVMGPQSLSSTVMNRPNRTVSTSVAPAHLTRGHLNPGDSSCPHCPSPCWLPCTVLEPDTSPPLGAVDATPSRQSWPVWGLWAAWRVRLCVGMELHHG